MKDDIIRIAALIRNGKSPEYDSKLLLNTAGQFIEDMTSGLGKSLDNIAWDSPDAGMIADLSKNVYQFSAAKNYHQLKDMTLALTDGDKILSESEYLDAVDKMNLKYNRSWLITERNNAIAASQMASRWNSYIQEAEIFPMLQYQTVGDKNVRPEHAALDGVRKPINDPFWDTWFPPNGWGCRCDVIQVPDEDARPTPDTSFLRPSLPEMFKTNMAKSGMIFPKGHPYYLDIPEGVISKAIYNIPPENGYLSYKADNGSVIDMHVMHGIRERAGNLEIANDLANLGYKEIRLLPDLNEKDISIRPKFMPEGYNPFDNRKNADAWILNAKGKDMVCDFKLMTGTGNFQRRIKEASIQSEYAIIKFKTDKIELDNIKGRANLEFEKRKRLKGLLVIDNDGKIIIDLTR